MSTKTVWDVLDEWVQQGRLHPWNGVDQYAKPARSVGGTQGQRYGVTLSNGSQEVYVYTGRYWVPESEYGPAEGEMTTESIRAQAAATQEAATQKAAAHQAAIESAKRDIEADRSEGARGWGKLERDSIRLAMLEQEPAA